MPSADLASQLKVLNSHINALMGELALRDAKINKLIEERRRYEQLAEQHKSHVQQLQRSTSWQLTAPLRVASRAALWFGRNMRRTLTLLGWLATGQLDHAASAVQPYLRKIIPRHLHGLIPVPRIPGRTGRQQSNETAASQGEGANTQPRRFISPTKQRLSFCFISSTSRAQNPILDGSVRYRCFHPAEALLSAGHKCCVVSQKRFVEMPSYDFDVYVFHRPAPDVGPLHSILERLKESGKFLIADYDDLVFGDELLALDSSLAKRGGDASLEAIAAFRRNTEALRFFERVTVSTYPLADKVKQFHSTAQVDVVHNTIPDSIFALSDRLEISTRPRPARQIGYFCGTNTHDADFRVVSEVIIAMLDNFPDATFVVLGPLKLPGALAFHPRVHTYPPCNYFRLSSVMSGCSIAIAPLVRGEFNDCKSRVKFLEASVAGCQLIASPIDDMTRAAEGRIALPTTPNEWAEVLTSMLSNHEAPGHDMEFVRSTSHASRAASSLLDIVRCAFFST
jgi:glycosyltransferase involved in cell wall biosynthesis